MKNPTAKCARTGCGCQLREHAKGGKGKCYGVHVTSYAQRNCKCPSFVEDVTKT